MGKYLPRSQQPVEAFRVSRETGPVIAAWAGGDWRSLVGRGDDGSDISHVALASNRRAGLGDWVVKKGDRFEVMSDTQFNVVFAEVQS